VSKTTTVEAPVSQVYELWSRFENLAAFMADVDSISVEDDRRISHWRVHGPAGSHFEWDAELLEDEPDERVSWRTISGRIQHRGTARFEALGPDRTRVTVNMSYNPPAGVLGHRLAMLLGYDPKTALDEDMVRMKSLLEDGHTTVDGREVRLAELLL
jgi:uncharacterized membrane protein